MKKLYTLLTFIITLTISAQAPQGFNYQATVRNNAGALMVNQNVTFKFNVIKDTPTSVPVFSETHYVPTDDLGAVNLVIGKGTATTGTFASIDWATGTYYLGIELNTGNGFKAMGTSQLLSVPYALYANHSGNGTSIGTISNTSNPKGATMLSGILSLTPADATNGGIITTSNQTLAGTKTFSSDVIVNGITVGKGAGNIASNTVLGHSSFTSNTTGNSNTAIGTDASKINTTGSNNTSLGAFSFQNNITGSANTTIGTFADVASGNLFNATAIGSQAIVNSSNTIQLGDQNVTDVKTAGKVTASGFKVPNGTSNQYLMADGSVSSTVGINSSLLGKIIYRKLVGNNTEIWIANYNGGNNMKINISLPAGVSISSVDESDGAPKISPDGSKLFFHAQNNTTNKYYIFSCNADGTNPVVIIESETQIQLGSVN